jgi:hypothetical protein
MAGPFLRTNINDEGFIRGAARILSEPFTAPFPTKISDIIVLVTGATQYDAVSAWTDLGATKTGIQVVRNNAEETFDVDQIQGDIASAPTNWEMNIGTSLAEVTLERIDEAWEGGTITTNATVSPNEKQLPLGQPDSYTQKRLAVVFQRPNGKVRAFVFRKVQRMPQESAFTFQKTGEQQSVPMRWRALADDTVADTSARFGIILDQI